MKDQREADQREEGMNRIFKRSFAMTTLSVSESIKRTVALILAATMLSGCASKDANQDSPQIVKTNEEQSSTGYIDSLTPGSDFYGYITAKDLMAMNLGNNDNTTGVSSVLQKEIDDQIDLIIDDIIKDSKDYERGSNEQLIHDLYYLAYDQLTGKKDVDKEDTEFVDQIVEMIDSVSTMDEYEKLSHFLLNEYGFSVYPCVMASPNIFNNEENLLGCSFSCEVDLEQLKDNQIYAVKYRDIIADSLKKTGVDPDQAKERATNVIYMLYEISSHTDYEFTSGEKEREECFNIYTRQECEEILDNLTYDELVYAGGYSGSSPDRIVIYDPDQIDTIDSVSDDLHVTQWKDLLIFTMLEDNSIWMPKKYNYSGLDVPDNDKAARGIVKKFLKDELCEEYAKKYMTQKKREIVTKMCEDIRSEYRVMINNADWLSKEGRDLLLNKLNNIEFFVGAGEPHKVDPKDADYIDTTLLKTMVRLQGKIITDNHKTLNEKVVRDGFKDVDICEVNAFYQRPINTVTINLGILGDPFFNEDADYATNLGGIGAIVGHEISHAFDSGGVKYDANGNYRPDAMPKADIEAFKAIQEKTVAYYDGFTVLGSHVNGKKTLGENLADLSGFQCVLAIAGEKDKQKEVFESYAKSWEQLLVDSTAKNQLENDEHAPNIVRVNAVVACFDEFYEIYDVKEGDAMYVAPENRVRRW